MKKVCVLILFAALIRSTLADELAPAPAPVPAPAVAPAADPAAAPVAEAAPAATDQAPAIFCEEPSFDFGSMDQTQTAKHEYVLVNKGNTTLEITQARPSCGCTVASISEKSVAPGAETRITAVLNLAGRTGPQHKTITVESNDPKQPQLTLTLQGSVGEIVSVQPAQVSLGQISADANAATEVIITSGNGQAFKILSAESSVPYLTTAITTKEDGKSYGVQVTTKGPMDAGPINANIHITTDHPAKATIDVPVNGLVAGDLIVAPQDITLSEQPDQTVTRYVIVRSGNNTAFEVKSIEPPDPSITVQVFPFGVNGFRIQLDNIKPTHALDGKNLKLTTSVESMKEINVPFHVVGS
jgi:hypothetical protein